MKKIAVLTATRAEYGLLSPIIKKLMKDEEVQVEVLVTGMHLSPEFGYTYKEIESDGISISKKIEILMSSDSAVGVSKAMGLALISFAEYFEAVKVDALLVLGDRYETLAVCCAAMNARIPIIHLYGGETTEGAIDEAIRHSITKMSYLHFTSTEEYRRRVIQLGEDPKRVFNVGAMGVENALNIPLMSKMELEESLGLSLEKPYALVTFHPVTLEGSDVEKQVYELLKAIDNFSNINFIFTKANADKGGKIINKMLDEYAILNKNAVVFESLGMRRYLSAIKYSRMVIGNSSSGLVEVPSFNIPTINIGNRQKGRTKGETVIDCIPERNDIVNAIKLATSEEFFSVCAKAENPYGGNNTSEQIVSIIKSRLLSEDIDLMKKFYDLSISDNIEVINVAN